MSFVQTLVTATEQGMQKLVLEIVKDAKNECMRCAKQGSNEAVLNSNKTKNLGQAARAFVEKEVKCSLDSLGFTQVSTSSRPWAELNFSVTLVWPVVDAPKESSSGTGSGNHVLSCGICKEQKPVVCLVPCGHLLCAGCGGADTCPFCRQAVSARQVVYHP
mmetsp:Transcript_5070/g.11885  ORF Transcript_5070/g.11885 Transcript_5070/m.11885 type:complete len:161 (+) Transcript_5070:23-505(+)